MTNLRGLAGIAPPTPSGVPSPTSAMVSQDNAGAPLPPPRRPTVRGNMRRKSKPRNPMLSPSKRSDVDEAERETGGFVPVKRGSKRAYGRRQ